MARIELAVNVAHSARLGGSLRERILGLSQAAEASGADQLVLTDHVVLCDPVVGHPGVAWPHPLDEEYPDPLVALAAAAAVTERIQLSMHLLVAPLRPPVLLAKMAATLDQLCTGRLVLTVGTGWQRAEFEALGVPYERRGARLDDTIEVCTRLWSGEPTTLTNGAAAFVGATCAPTPVRRSVPIWFGGPANATMAARVARLGHGWAPLGGTTPDEVERGVELIAEACRRCGRAPETIAIRAALPGPGIDEAMAAVDAHVRAGATMVQLPAVGLLADDIDGAAQAFAAAASHVGSLAQALG